MMHQMTVQPKKSEALSINIKFRQPASRSFKTKSTKELFQTLTTQLENYATVVK